MYKMFGDHYAIAIFAIVIYLFDRTFNTIILEFWKFLVKFLSEY